MLPIEHNDYRVELDDRYERLLKESYRKHFYDNDEHMIDLMRLLCELLIITGFPKTANELMADYRSVKDIPE
jgi:hypothetical protein